jgi:precorrin-2 dehydrogenase/sirohydrochlorin ferrochelatase
VVSPSCCDEIRSLAGAGDIRLHQREYREGDLEDAFVVIAATDDRQTNLAIAEAARRAGCLVNAVDDPASSDFIVPACVRRGDITIAVSTSGKSPALARKLRTRLEAEFSGEYAELARLVGEVREAIRAEGLKISEKAWQQSLDLEVLVPLLREGKIEEARAAIARKLVKGSS